MGLNGSRGSAAIFPMICCAKLARIFENSKHTLKTVISENCFEQKKVRENETDEHGL